MADTITKSFGEWAAENRWKLSDGSLMMLNLYASQRGFSLTQVTKDRFDEFLHRMDAFYSIVMEFRNTDKRAEGSVEAPRDDARAR